MTERKGKERKGKERAKEGGKICRPGSNELTLTKLEGVTTMTLSMRGEPADMCHNTHSYSQQGKE